MYLSYGSPNRGGSRSVRLLSVLKYLGRSITPDERPLKHISDMKQAILKRIVVPDNESVMLALRGYELMLGVEAKFAL